MVIARILTLTLALWATSASGDSNQDTPFPFNCSTRAFCSSLRTKLPTKNELYNAQFIDPSHGVLHFNLANPNGNQLILLIGGVVNNRFRVTIEEPDHHRYKLEYSLEKDPTVKDLVVINATDEAVTAVDAEGNKVIVRTTPLAIEFYHDDVLETVLEGDRIIMENTEESQAFTFSVRFNGAKRLMGLHEHTTGLSLKHTVDFSTDPYRLKNVDFGGTGIYDLNSTKSMYGSIPVLYGFGNQTSGVFVHNAAEMFVDVNNDQKSAYFMVDGGTLDLFVLLGPSLPETVRQYVDLTGKPHLPQLWALGYHQCRWAYNNTEDVKDTISKFDAYNFPLDVLWLDIEYTADRKWFTWNLTSFPDPIEVLNWVDQQGHRKLVPISDPHIKIDPDYQVYADCLKNDYFIKSSDGVTPYVGTCWPGNSNWIDFLNPAARDYYASRHLYKNFLSTSTLGGYWNDMNEPATFDNMYENTIPLETMHYGNVKHRDVHNIYGMLQTMSTHEGLMARDNGTLRPFILSRAYFAGSQRYTSKWSGDNWCVFEDMRYSVPMALTSNLVGVAFYGADIPGFNGSPTEELVSRWYQIAIWLPFFRAHANYGTPRREPFRFSNATQKILRDVLQFRYKHIPYWYTLFYEHSRTGDPIIRPLLYQYPEDETVYDLSDELLIGSDILAASVYTPNATQVSVYFPGTNDFWYQVTGNSSSIYQGGTSQDIKVDITFSPVFYRSGSLILRKPNVLRSTADTRDTPYELHAITDKDGNAKTRIYIDDFESFKYVNQKNYLYLDVSLDGTTVITEPIDSDTDPTGLSLTVETLYIYSPNGNGTYSVKKYQESKDGKSLVDINLMEQPILL